ncbi:coiled-coil domain-containing protein [Lihuaxuella thermophila]|uniref:DUF4175 domain-containing protein n=1 Tax=Lihuaxuella thermophila TaxID=1173111 RepID=A0A1H8HF12_9BACL|nr:hypothetical protein [Lihuaxuella thermophila]SEN54861.1 hypothetical protein SAMN05444955_1145 [Lihuaxuella thermophila]
MKRDDRLPGWLNKLVSGRNRIWKDRIWRWAKNGAWAGLAAGCGVLLLARAVPLAHPGLMAGWLGLLGVVGGCMVGIWKRPGWTETVSILDDRLDLEDRLVTAWQMRNAPGDVVALQREDALQHLQEKLPSLKERMPFRWGTRKEGISALGLTALCTLLLLLPNPLTEIARQQEKIRLVIEKERDAVEKQQEKAAEAAKVSPEMKRSLQKELAQLFEQLDNSETLEQAAEKMAESLEKLNQLKQKMEQEKAPAEEMLQRWMEEGKLAALGKEMAEGGGKPSASTGEAVKKVLSDLTPDEKKKLAQQLNELGQKWAQSDSASAREAASHLRQAARELAGNSPAAPRSVAQALSSAGNVMSRQQADEQIISQSQQLLQAGKTAIAAASGNRAALGGNTTDNRLTGDVSTGGSTSNNGAGTTPSGTGNGSGTGNTGGSGSGNGSGTGSGIAGSNGLGAGQGAGSRHVLVPWSRVSGGGPRDTVGGPQGEGTEEVGQTWSTLPGISRPYEEVYREYQSEVRQALERGDLPPEWQQIIRDYFSSIEP